MTSQDEISARIYPKNKAGEVLEKNNMKQDEPLIQSLTRLFPYRYRSRPQKFEIFICV